MIGVIQSNPKSDDAFVDHSFEKPRRTIRTTLEMLRQCRFILYLVATGAELVGLSRTLRRVTLTNLLLLLWLMI